MNKIAIMVDNVRPLYENKLLFEAMNELYQKDRNSSISLFSKDIDWAYKNIEYGIFKWIDYQNFEGHTIVTNVELLDFVAETAHNNKISLYCHDFPFCLNISGIKAMKLLTNPKLSVYCRVGYINDFMKTFGCKTKVATITETINELLYD